jgi:hypothetical protein
MISTSRRKWAAGLAVAFTLGATGVAQAQQQGYPVRITSKPVISGNPFFGSTLFASGGAWQSPNPDEANRTESWFEWWRCPETNEIRGCDFRQRGTAYGISGSDAGEYVYLARYVRWLNIRDPGDPDDDRWVQDMEVSAPVGPVRAAPAVPTPAPTPVPTVAPTPTPTATPVPTFDTIAASPVTTQGEILQETARSRRVIRPFPVVRMKGRLTARGADVQVLSVRAPRNAKISVRCRGRSCPAGRWSRSERKSRLTRMERYERNLRAGVKITVSVTRRGYVGKRTTFVIRRGMPPLRSDRCLSSKGRVTRCPSGVS